MTTLSSNSAVPFVVDMVADTNDQYDFLAVIINFIEAGHLVGISFFISYVLTYVEGDYLIMDNCRIHGAQDTLTTLFNLLEAAGVHLVYLPPYSPELNPCELVFASVKNYLRFNRGKDNFDKEIMFALSHQSHASVAAMYMDCIWLDFLDPPVF